MYIYKFTKYTLLSEEDVGEQHGGAEEAALGQTDQPVLAQSRGNMLVEQWGGGRSTLYMVGPLLVSQSWLIAVVERSNMVV